MKNCFCGARMLTAYLERELRKLGDLSAIGASDTPAPQLKVHRSK